MKEIFDIIPVGVAQKCDSCGEGYMQVTGESILMSDPPQFGHKCDKCDHTENFSTKYPTVDFMTPEQLAEIKRNSLVESEPDPQDSIRDEEEPKEGEVV